MRSMRCPGPLDTDQGTPEHALAAARLDADADTHASGRRIAGTLRQAAVPASEVVWVSRAGLLWIRSWSRVGVQGALFVSEPWEP